MNEFDRFASLMAQIAYELHDKDFVDEPLRELLLDLWREFSNYDV